MFKKILISLLLVLFLLVPTTAPSETCKILKDTPIVNFFIGSNGDTYFNIMDALQDHDVEIMGDIKPEDQSFIENRLKNDWSDAKHAQFPWPNRNGVPDVVNFYVQQKFLIDCK
jgi:hypothetical protein